MRDGLRYKMVMKNKDGTITDRYEMPDILGGLDGSGQGGFEFPEIALEEDKGGLNAVRVYRPLRFDVYALFKPLAFLSRGNPEMLVLRPNMGFSVDINDAKGYFNIGLETRFNLINLFTLHIGSNLQEDIWMHRLGFALNLRAFELNVEGILRSQSYAGGFDGQGAGVTVGIVFGW